MEANMYIAGYIKNKIRKKFPDCSEPFLTMGDASSKWIELKNRGRLNVPSEGLVDRLRVWVKWFVQFHGKTINRDSDPVDNFCKLIIERENLIFDQDIYAAKLYLKIEKGNVQINLAQHTVQTKPKKISYAPSSL